jgi:hypothetical protein
MDCTSFSCHPQYFNKRISFWSLSNRMEKRHCKHHYPYKKMTYVEVRINYWMMWLSGRYDQAVSRSISTIKDASTCFKRWSMNVWVVGRELQSRVRHGNDCLQLHLGSLRQFSELLFWVQTVWKLKAIFESGVLMRLPNQYSQVV